jgi:hypothetical protein
MATGEFTESGLFIYTEKRTATGHSQQAPLGCQMHYMTTATQMAFTDCLTKLKQTQRLLGRRRGLTARASITITSDLTSRSRNSGPECCLLKKERNQDREKTPHRFRYSVRLGVP